MRCLFVINNVFDVIHNYGMMLINNKTFICIVCLEEIGVYKKFNYENREYVFNCKCKPLICNKCFLDTYNYNNKNICVICQKKIVKKNKIKDNKKNKKNKRKDNTLKKIFNTITITNYYYKLFFLIVFVLIELIIIKCNKV
jgi:hypothetical protein